MEEIKVGEYVRTKCSGIFKIKDIDFESFEIIQGNNRVWEFDDLEEMEDFIKGSIVKHGTNIIDLIEVGDYVNGHLVIAVDREKLEVSIENCMYGSDYEDINGNIDIKSIVTKEQYNSIKYVIGE